MVQALTLSCRRISNRVLECEGFHMSKFNLKKCKSRELFTMFRLSSFDLDEISSSSGWCRWTIIIERSM